MAGDIKKESLWHNPSEMPECDDYEQILYNFKSGESLVLFAKSEVDWSRVKCWAYWKNVQVVRRNTTYKPCGCYLKHYYAIGCAFPELTCEECRFKLTTLVTTVPSMNAYRTKRDTMYFNRVSKE